MRRAPLLAILLALLGCVGPAAADLRPLADVGSFLVGDDGRWAVASTDGAMLVVDGRDRRLRTRRVDLAGPCAAPFGIPRALGGGQVLVECAFALPAGRGVLTYDLRARTFTEFPFTDRLTGFEGASLTGIGERWVAYDEQGRRTATPRLLDRRTGARADPTVAGDRVVDLDLAAGSRRLCRGLRRPARGSTFAYADRTALELRIDRAGRRVLLRPCSGPPTVLSRAPDAAGARLGSDLVTWHTRRSAFARDRRTGKTRRVAVARGERVATVVAAGRRVVVLVVTKGSRFTVRHVLVR